MKKILLFVFVFSMLQAHSQWNELTAPSVNYPVSQVVEHNGMLYATGNNGVFSSGDWGNSWTDLTNGFAQDPANSWREIVFAGDDIYARSTQLAVIKSTDNGATWSYDTVGLDSGAGWGEKSIISIHFNESL